MRAITRGDGEISGLIFIALLALLFYGGYKLWQEWAGSGVCQTYAERWCYQHPIAGQNYSTCVETALKWAQPEAWCREGLRDLDSRK